MCNGTSPGCIAIVQVHVSKSAFDSALKSPDQFFCPLCHLSKSELEIKELKNSISVLKNIIKGVVNETPVPTAGSTQDVINSIMPILAIGVLL